MSNRSVLSDSEDSETFIQELQKLLLPAAPRLQLEKVIVFSRSHSPSDSDNFEESYTIWHSEFLDNPETEEDPQENSSLTSVRTK